MRELSDIQNPELVELLRQVDPRGGSAPFPLEEKRRAYRETVSRSGPAQPVESIRDSDVAGLHHAIPIRLYQAGQRAAPMPIVLYFHGGGFFSGDLETHDRVCRSLANGVPATVVAVDYRLAPEHRYPAALDDCFAVLRWVSQNATSLHGLASRVVVAGDSAGGNLAAATALMARDRGDHAPAAQVLIYPMLDATLSSPSLVRNALIPPFTLLDCVYSWQQYLSPTIDRRDPYVSPVQAQDLADLPPALVITAEFDILADEGQTFVDELRDSDVRVEHEHFPDMTHGFFQWAGVVGAGQVAMDRVVQFLQQF